MTAIAATHNIIRAGGEEVIPTCQYQLWKHKGDSERYVLTIYSQDERLPRLATSVMGSYGLEIAKDILKRYQRLFIALKKCRN